MFSRFVSDDWTGGQLHFSFTWPEALNSGPLYSYGNTLNPAGLGTRQYHGYFYTDVGRSRDVNTDMQGPRVFEYWFQQAWGKNNGLNYWRIGATNPWITFNKSIVSGLHGFWAFNEPGIIGTTPSTANGPLITTAPMGISLAREVGNNLHLKGMIMNGYYDPSGGLDNKRGLNQYWDLDEYGLEIIYEATYRGGTYSQEANIKRVSFLKGGVLSPIENEIDVEEASNQDRPMSELLVNFIASIKPFSKYNHSLISLNTERDLSTDVNNLTGEDPETYNGGFFQADQDEVFGIGVAEDKYRVGSDFKNTNYGLRIVSDLDGQSPNSVFTYVMAKNTLQYSPQGISLMA